MDYAKLNLAEQTEILENTLHQAEADHFRAVLEREAAPPEMQEVMQENVTNLENRCQLVSRWLDDIQRDIDTATPTSE